MDWSTQWMHVISARPHGQHTSTLHNFQQQCDDTINITVVTWVANCVSVHCNIMSVDRRVLCADAWSAIQHCVCRPGIRQHAAVWSLIQNLRCGRIAPHKSLALPVHFETRHSKQMSTQHSSLRNVQQHTVVKYTKPHQCCNEHRVRVYFPGCNVTDVPATHAPIPPTNVWLHVNN